MTVVVVPTWTTGETFDPTKLNNAFQAVKNCINGQVAPDNLKTDQVHVPFGPVNVGPVAAGGTVYVIIARPANITSGTLLLEKLVYSATGDAAVGALGCIIKGCTSLANALTGTGTTLTGWGPKNLTAAVGLIAVEDSPGLDVIAYTHYFIQFTAGAGTNYAGVSLSGELVYTIQET